MVDRTSGYVECAAIPNKNATTVARAIDVHILKRYGPPRFASHDQGTEFHNKLVKEMKDMQGVSSAYHPQDNGKGERLVKTVKQKLCRMLTDPDNFDSD